MLTKAQTIDHIAKEVGVKKETVEKIYGSLAKLIKDGLIAGDDVRLVGVGTLKVATRAARIGRNPQTGEDIQIPSAKVVKFTVTKDLKDALN